RHLRRLPGRSSLVVVGEGPERPKLKVLAKTLKIADKVVFLGHVEAVEEVLSRLDVFALTSRTEQMPNSILQAMAAGKPIAAVDVGDVQRMLAPENRAFVVPGDDQRRFARGLEQLLADSKLRRNLGRKNQTHVQAHYPQERMFKAYEAMFEEAVKSAT
ncbi:MAG: glycosyltransferase family 4 protein, partial [Kiloniellaceae bacterium]